MGVGKRARMSKRVSILAGLALAMAVTAQVRAEEELVDSQIYKSWAAHGVGTKVVTEGKMSGGPMQMNMEMTSELVEKDAAQVVVEVQTTVTIPGMPAQQPPKQKMVFKAKVPKGQEVMGQLPADHKAELKEIGTEKVEVGGKSYECKVLEFKGTSPTGDASGKVWTHQDIPGHTVKLTMTGTGQGQTMTLDTAVRSFESK